MTTTAVATLAELDGFIDIDIPIKEVTRRSDGLVLVARGVLEGVQIGLRLELADVWAEQRVSDDDESDVFFYRGKISLMRTGPESDNLLMAMHHAYGASVERCVFRDQVNLDAVGLNADPRRTATNGVRMKAFFDSKIEEPGQAGESDCYAELFVNVDIEAGVLQLHEKDSDYRADLLTYLRRLESE